MNMFYLPSTEEMINGDHIIRAKLYPSHVEPEHIDDESGNTVPQRFISSRLDLWLAEIELDEVSSYDGEIKGVASKSISRCIRGLEAEALWEVLKCASIHTPLLPTEQEQKEMGVRS
jgi:hypothetical protein